MRCLAELAYYCNNGVRPRVYTRSIRERWFCMVMWKRTIWFTVAFLLLSCGKNDGIRTAGGGYYPQGPTMPMSGPQFPPSNPYPNYPGGYGPGGGGYFQPGYYNPYGPQFYPWMPIYVYYQQVVYLQPVFITLWTGWQNFAYANQISVYDFPQFWYNYCPQAMSPQLYNYFSNTFYPWMTPTIVLYPSYSPQTFWQNYSGMPYQIY